MDSNSFIVSFTMYACILLAISVSHYMIIKKLNENESNKSVRESSHN